MKILVHRLALFLTVACAIGLSIVRAAEIPLSERRSAYDGMSRATRAIQDDDTANPATFWVLDGNVLWTTKTGAAQHSCADCHGDASVSMKGVAARYPSFDDKRGRAVDLEERINLCRTEQQQAKPLPLEGHDLLALAAAIGRYSRGLPIAPDENKLASTIERGKAIYSRRQGQLNLSCSNCHNDNWDNKLAGSPITQGHPTGYPMYRLEWQSVGSLQRRLHSCMAGMRADPYPFGSPEIIALETYLMWRARGMKIETPAVRP